jgi:hypothetical protein
MWMLERVAGPEGVEPMRVRLAFAITLPGILAHLSGCAETLPLAQLPDPYKLPDKVLSKDEQQGKVNQMIEKSQSHEVEAAKQIEKNK